MGIKPAMSDEAKEEGVTLTLQYIPNDVFDKRAIAKGEVKFFNVGYLEVKPKQTKDGSVTVELEDFGVFYAQDDADSAAAGLKNSQSKVIIDNGQVVRVTKDKKGIVKKEVLTESWQDWIDYWAVDFDFQSQKEIIAVVEGEETKEIWTGRYIFENEWQDFRVRGDRSLRTVSDPHTYDTPGEYKIAVKVVDVFGNDTTKVVKVKVK
jgi:adenine-specific DNA-methyltransferase